nr:hypothetical protein [candidate division Zixibacteria bacterium]
MQSSVRVLAASMTMMLGLGFSVLSAETPTPSQVGEDGDFLTGLTCYYGPGALEPLNLDLWFGGDTVDNQGMHPDIVDFPDGFGPSGGNSVIGLNRERHLDTLIASTDTPRWRYWMAFTPYPYGLAAYEDPTIRVSSFMDRDWIRPFAIGDDPSDSSDMIDTIWVEDPISDFGIYKSGSIIDPDTIWNEYLKLGLVTTGINGHNADPEFIRDPDDRIIMVAFLSNYLDFRRIQIIALNSPDGITWNKSDTIFIATADPNQSDPYAAWSYLSPTLCYFGGGYYYLWFVDKIGLERGTQVIRMLLPGLGMPPVMIDTCLITPPAPNKQIWHLKIRPSPKDGNFYMLATINGKNTTSMDNTGQYLYVSADGVNWSMVREVIPHGSIGQWDFYTYRSTFLFDSFNGETIFPAWYSGACYVTRSEGNPEKGDGNTYLIWKTGFTVISNAPPPGDTNDDCNVNILDVTYLLNYLYKGGPPPPSVKQSDVNGDCKCNILDITHLIKYLYLGATPPVEGCELPQ